MTGADDLPMPEDPFMGEMPSIKDPYVLVYLNSGTTIDLTDVSILDLSRRLMAYGFAYLADGKGDYMILFAQNISAIQASSTPFNRARH